MKTFLGTVVGTAPLLSAGVALAQAGTMMNDGWMSGYTWMSGYGGMGGYGGILVPLLLVIVVAGVAMWFVKQKGK
jgi:uncharacterized membrane protein